MQPGDVLAGRFELERRAGAGGMGEVFRARDRASGQVVAVKVLLERRSGEGGRFAREATVLSELRHHGIVRYVAHGATAAGEPYLVMEWLEGEDLSCRLERGALTVDETLALVASVSEALAVAHARGVVHRDLKPSNLFLVEGNLQRVKVLDFGIAHLSGATTMTKTGMVLGTPGYMAPEQARGEQDVDARVDVFALGCVLFECLTGAPLFTGEHVMAVLAKILFQEAPRMSERRPEAPPALDALCARMLAKDRDERPRDGAAVAEALGAWGPTMMLPTSEASPTPGPLPLALTGSERRVLSVVLLGQAPPIDSVAPTLDQAELLSTQEELRRTVEACGGRLEFLADGSAMVTITRTTRIATDQATQAARCALVLRAIDESRSLALATGRGELTGKLAIGDVIDRAARMLVKCDERALPKRGHMQPIAIDEVTAGLLDARFKVVDTEAGLKLHGEHEAAEGARTLLGKATACVGRDWELSTLDALLTECIEDSIARAVLVTAPAGMGKSRLVYEFVRRVQQRGEEIAVWSGRIDSLQAGSAFGLLGQVLRAALSIQGGEPIEIRRDKIRARVAEHVPADDQRRVAEFIGELVGTLFPDDASAPLRAARRDAQLMGDQMNLAFLDFLRAETSAHPVLIVLEDLHWGDLPTVRFIDAALRELRGQPWMVLALARPELHELFPKLWAGRAVQEIRLKELTRRASERLVRQVLGDSVDAETVERIVVQAAGHAFYLEELVRAVAEGKGAALPETVLAMIEARLAGLDPEARRVLRAASVFGEVFWHSGVTLLLGGTMASARAGKWLSDLAEREVLVRRAESRFSGEQEFAFRHALLREGAYATLTAEDQILGHRLAGTWLESTSSDEALTMAEHFSRGGEPARAVRWYRRAAEQALAADDLHTVLACAERGVACGAAGEDLGGLRLSEAEAYDWRGELARSQQRGVEATALLEPGSVRWFRAFAHTIIAASKLSNFEQIEQWVGLVHTTSPAANAQAARISCLCYCVICLTLAGRYSAADALSDEMDRKSCEYVAPEATAVAALAEMRAYRALTAGDSGSCLKYQKAALAAFEQAGDRRNACSMRVNLGFILAELGDFERGEEALRAALATADKMGLHDISALARQNLGYVLAYRGELEEARRLAQQAIDMFHQQGGPRHLGAARTYLAKIELFADDFATAEREAQSAVQALLAAPPIRAFAVAVLARALLCQGRVNEALTAARETFTLLSSLGTLEEGESLVRLTYAEVLYATGDFERSYAAIAAARDRLLANASKIGDPDYRRSFLENVPENARTLSLAREWLDGDPSAPALGLMPKH